MITALLFAAALTDPQVLGAWVAVDRSSGGLGTIVNFLPAGKLETSYGAIVETWYRVEGDKFTQPSGTKDGKPTVVRFHIKGNTLQFDSEPAPTRFTRIGAARRGEPPIVGQWRVDPQHTIEYTRDNLIKIRYVMSTKTGTYDEAAKTFTFPEGAGQYHLDNGLLIMSGGGAPEQTFVRSDASKEELRRAGVRYGEKPADLDPPAAR